MNRAEALNVAWHVRVNGLRDVKQETIREAFAVLERECRNDWKEAAETLREIKRNHLIDRPAYDAAIELCDHMVQALHQLRVAENPDDGIPF